MQSEDIKGLREEANQICIYKVQSACDGDNGLEEEWSQV